MRINSEGQLFLYENRGEKPFETDMLFYGDQFPDTDYYLVQFHASGGQSKIQMAADQAIEYLDHCDCDQNTLEKQLVRNLIAQAGTVHFIYYLLNRDQV